VEGWYERELANARQVRPIALEAAFGTSDAPCILELQPGRSLHLEGRIDRVDQRLCDGALVLRDYKTGRAPSGKSALFETARRLQMPIYMWAARRLFPGQNLAEAALDYVDGGRLLGMRPDEVSEEALTELLRGLASAMASGYFVQEPSSCETCDLTSVCGPHAALEWRMRRKSRDRRLRALRRLREGA
jgi:RecB family exonuclease